MKIEIHGYEIKQAIYNYLADNLETFDPNKSDYSLSLNDDRIDDVEITAVIFTDIDLS